MGCFCIRCVTLLTCHSWFSLYTMEVLSYPNVTSKLDSQIIHLVRLTVRNAAEACMSTHGENQGG